MKKISLISALLSGRKYSKMTPAKREELRNIRLSELVNHAKKLSPYYSRLYKDIKDKFSLTDLPPVNKRDLMAHWDEWVCDRTVSLADVQHFMDNSDNIGRWLNGKYLVFTTSGSTGNPLVCLNDQNVKNVSDAVNILRAYARSEDLKAFIGRGGKSAGVFADNGFYLGNSSIRTRLRKMPWKKRQMTIVDVLLPIESIVEQLNAFQPAMLGGYPSSLELLIKEQESGRLHISPIIVMTGGEYLPNNLRRRLSEAFGCYVQTSYACTEAGNIACECRNQHFHINDDWVLIEPVDAENNPVPPGRLADKILLTSLANYTQPFIRYEVTDRVILHNEPCGCGNPSPWLELEGRTDDTLIFENGVQIAPLPIYAVLKEIHEIDRFQLIQVEHNHLELRLIAEEKQIAFEKAKNSVEGYLRKNGVSARITLSEKMPEVHPNSGKFRHIVGKQELR